MTKFLIASIDFYQKYLSPDQGLPRKIGLSRGSTCVFYPTCSNYMKEAILKYGPVRGLGKGIRRILRCHPWQKSHIDPLI